MDKRILHLLALTLMVAFRAFGEPVPVASYQRGFTLVGRPDRYVLHVRKPAPDGEVGTPGAHDGLKHFANFVRADAEAKHFLNEVTRPRYERELKRLEEGYWPTVYVTREGSNEIVGGLCYAIQWGDERLPFQESFYDLGIRGQPREKPLVQRLVDPLQENTFHKYSTLSFLPNEIYLRELLQQRPYIGGTSAEIKFLSGTHAVRYLQVFHQASMDFELHRDSRVKVTEEAREMYRAFVKEHGQAIEKYPVFRSDPDHPVDAKELRRLSEYFHERLYDESWQAYVRNTRLYVQASDPGDPNGLLKSPHYRLFVDRLGFSSKAFWSFAETKETGTEGVSTRILMGGVRDYEWVTGADVMFFISGMDARDAAVFDPNAAPPCRAVYSRMEAALDDHMRLTR